MDFYELTMSQCYFNDNKDKEVVFDLFYRKNPDDGGYCVFAGLEQVVDYVSNLHFEKEDIDYLRSLNQFSEDFLEYLSTIHFHHSKCDIIPECGFMYFWYMIGFCTVFNHDNTIFIHIVFIQPCV